MSTSVKIVLGIVVVALIGGGIFANMKYKERGVVTVQTGKPMKQDLASVVTSSGEVKPRTYINISAEYQGRLTEILVKEGDHVRKGQLLARIDEAQSEADVAAQKAVLSSAEADASASEAGYKAAEDNILTLEASLNRTKTDLERYELDFKRGEQLLAQGLIPKSDFEQRRAAYQSQQGAIAEASARVVQAKSQLGQVRAQMSSAQRRIAQSQAGLTRVNDILRKHNVVAPINGLVTYLPVRIGENVVPGVQNSAASTIMTIADMSIVTAEVKVDETDIVNIKVNQAAEITIDALPNKIFVGHVLEIGNTAILRSTGLAASQSSTSSQEAKDFKVVVAMDNPPDEVRPGLSCTAKITTAVRKDVLALPIQALTIRTKGDLDTNPIKPENPDPATVKANAEEVQGVFVIGAENKAEFKKVETGITGVTNIEVISGLTGGEQIITGSYQVIRTIKHGAVVKVDNKPASVKTGFSFGPPQ